MNDLSPYSQYYDIFTFVILSFTIYQKLEIIHSGCFQVKFSDALYMHSLKIGNITPIERLQIIGNLPFGISSILLIKLIESVCTPSQESGTLGWLLWQLSSVEFVFMFQKEVAHVCIILFVISSIIYCCRELLQHPELVQREISFLL